MNIDTWPPRVSWQLRGRGDTRQTAYRIQAASSRDLLLKGIPDIWDSGRTAGDAQTLLEIGGHRKTTHPRVWWRVMVWNQLGSPGPWSRPTWFETSPSHEEWTAQWIADPRPQPASDAQHFQDRPNPLLRREFVVKSGVRDARLYIAGLGYYEASLNGESIMRGVRLDPGWTDYRKRVCYSTFDVTDNLRTGRNAVGIELGHGWWDIAPIRLFGRFNLRRELGTGPMCARAMLKIWYRDGTTETVGTDAQWKCGQGTVVRDNVYLGEHVDHRLLSAGWNRAGFDDTAWQPVRTGRDAGPAGRMQAQSAQPIRAIEEIEPKSISKTGPGRCIVDMGRNFAGVVRLRAAGARGTTIVLRYGELLNRDGSLNVMTSVAGQLKRPRNDGGASGPDIAWQEDRFTLRGEGLEQFEPRFTFHGFRYVEVSGFPGTLKKDSITGIALSSGVQTAGGFTSSDPTLNAIQQMCLNTFRSNLFSVQSDCPAREKLGYGGDIVACGDALMANYDMFAFYKKTVLDFADAQRPNGGFTETAPYVGIADEGLGEGSGPPEWGAAHPYLVWELYRRYGDRRLLQQQYPNIVRFVALMTANAKEGILDYGISDHESLVPKPKALTGTYYYWFSVDIAAKAASALGRTEEARRYETLAKSISEAMRAKFLQGCIDGSASQASCALMAQVAVRYGWADSVTAGDWLRRRVRQDGGRLTTGIFGTLYLLPVLATVDPDAAHRLAVRKEFPGWGHMLASGATTLWEHWEFSDNVYSHNHPMFGSISGWFQQGLLGIDAAVGTCTVSPTVPTTLSEASGWKDTPRGRITVSWRQQGGRLEVRTSVPIGLASVLKAPSGWHFLGGGERRELPPGDTLWVLMR
jgi:alpha-L-rhamnosidase